MFPRGRHEASPGRGFVRDDDVDYFFECVIPRIGASQVLLCWFCITVAKGRKGLFEFLYGSLGMVRRMRIMIDDVLGIRRRGPLSVLEGPRRSRSAMLCMAWEVGQNIIERSLHVLHPLLHLNQHVHEVIH